MAGRAHARSTVCASGCLRVVHLITVFHTVSTVVQMPIMYSYGNRDRIYPELQHRVITIWVWRDAGPAPLQYKQSDS
jgi:hypothetical protein